MLEWLYRSKTWQASRQRCRRDTCQISKRLEKSKPETRDFESLRNFAVRRPPAYRNVWPWTVMTQQNKTKHNTIVCIFYGIFSIQVNVPVNWACTVYTAVGYSEGIPHGITRVCHRVSCAYAAGYHEGMPQGIMRVCRRVSWGYATG